MSAGSSSPRVEGVLRVAQIIVAALVVGLASGTAVMAMIARPQFPDQQWAGVLGAAVATAAIVFPLIAPPFLRPTEVSPDSPDARGSLAAFVLTTLIVREAILDGVGFLNAMIHFLTGSPLALGAAIAVIAALAALIPTRASFDARIDRWLQERRDESQFG